MRIAPFSAPLGAEVHGLDAAAPLNDAADDELVAALETHLVLLLRDQRLDDPALIRFSERFGTLDPPGPNPYGAPFLPAHPEINVISNVVEGGRPIGNLGAGEAIWHADMTYIDRPPKAALLYAIETPKGQGDTYFANQYAAFEALPERLARRIAGRTIVHDSAHNSAGMLRKGRVTPADPTRTEGARHPIVRRDAQGRQALFLGRRPHAYVDGLPLAESEQLLDDLWAHAAQPEFVWSHQWRPGDLLIWHNLGVLHRRDAFDPNARRVMHRTQIKGDDAIVA